MKLDTPNRKPFYSFFQLPLTVFVIGSLSSAVAQVDDSADDEEVYTLSPFEVDVSQDSGYYASQTLAGGRLKSDLKDVATTVQVVTEEFLDDIGASDISEVLVYTTNTDVVGSMSSYNAAEAEGDSTLSSASVRQNPGLGNRVRGLGRATLTANYFKTSVPFDRYVSGRVDINRGANSFLFGLGSPGGIINSSLAQAEFRDSSKVDFQISTENFENNYSKRGSFNFNREIIDDRLAVRIAAMKAEDEYTQQPAMKDTERAYIAAKVKLFEKHRVYLSGFYETGEIDAIPVDRIAPLETLSNFIDDPYGTVFDTPSGRWSHDPFGNIVNNIAGNTYLGVDAAGNPLALAQYNKSLKANGWGTVYDNTVTSEGLPTRAFHTGWTNNRIRINNPYYDPNGNLTGNTQSFFVRGLRMTDLGGDYQGWTRQGLTDYDIYDWRKNLLTGSLDYYSNDFDRRNLTLEAVSKDGNFGIEASYYYEKWNRDSYVGIGTPEITLDNNLTLPAGPNELFGDYNPNYGKLYIAGLAANNSLNQDIRTVKRVTAFAKYDFKEHFDDGILSWLGRHTVTGLFDHDKLEQEQFAYRQFIFGNDAGFHLAQANATQYQRQMLGIYYISDAFPQAFTDPNFQMSDFQVSGMPANANSNYPSGYEIPVSHVSMGNPATDTGWNRPVGDEAPAVGAFTPEWQPTSGTLLETVVESKAMNLQSFFLNDLIVANFGWREDQVKLKRNANPPKTDEQVPILDSEGFNLDGIEAEVEKKSIFSYGVVAHVPDQWLPEGTTLSLHYGESENFVPNPGGYDWYGNQVPGASGSTEEMGVTVSLMDKKVVARLNFYKGTLADEKYVGTDRAYKLLGTAQIARAYESLWDEMDTRDRNRDGVIDNELIADPNNPGSFIEFDPDLDDNGLLDSLEGDGNSYLTLGELTALEAAYSELMNPWVRETTDLTLISGADTDDGNPISTSGNGLWFTLGDTVTLEAEGIEFELTYNPSRNLRLSMNISQQKSQISDVAPRLTDVWNQLIAISEQIPSAQYVSNGGGKMSTALRDEAYASNTLMGTWIQNAGIGGAYLSASALSGSDNPEVRKYRVNFLGNYSFTEGVLEGLNIGGAFRYQDEAAAGYPKIADPATGFIVSDVMNPYYDDSKKYVDVWFGYKRKIWNDKVDWRIQLNIRNLFANDDPVPIQFQPDGSVARVSIPVPRQFVLSNTLSF